MRRLYQKIYLTIIVSLLVVVLFAGALWRADYDESPAAQAFAAVGELLAETLPPAGAPVSLQQRAVEALSQRFRTDVSLFDRDYNRIAAAGEPLPLPRRARETSGRFFAPFPALSFHLPDGRWLVARAPLHQNRPGLRLIFFLGLIALVVAACAYPVVRGLTRRLERLQVGVETLGAGNLAARVQIKGRDEVARLAESFNSAAARIEELVGAHRLLLANASHELRTPLSRIRMGVELYQTTGDAKYKTELERDIAELDVLIDEILLASRLESARELQTVETVDLLATVAEECARYDGCTLDGEPTVLRGDARLLRRLVRNLLENAGRHGRPPVQIFLYARDGCAVLDVVDSGLGIPEAERERVFTPFHRLAHEATGAGLGLSLVRRIARLHGGDAQAVTRPGAPSCMRVTLPLPASAAAR